MDCSKKTTPRLCGTTLGVQQVDQTMRDEMTPAEQALWQAFKEWPLAGLKFRAQHPVVPFVLDFYCSRYKLVVELDGDIYDQQQNRDAARTNQHSAYGYRVVRFRNEEVLTDLPAILEMIFQAATASGPPIIGG